MSEEDNRLDSVFKSKVDSKQVEFKEEDWLKAKAMITTDRRNKKKRFFLFCFVALVLLSIGTTYVLRPVSTPENTAASTAAIPPPALPDESNGNTVSEKSHVTLTNSEEHSSQEQTSENLADEQSNHQNDRKYKKEPGIVKKSITTSHNNDAPVSRKSALRNMQSAKENNEKPARRHNRKTLPPKEDQTYVLTDSITDGTITPNTTNDILLISTKANKPFFKVTGYCDTCQKSVESYLAYNNKQRRKNSVTLIAGINYYNSGEQWYSPLNFHGGLMFHHFVSKQISLNTGILYNRINQQLPARAFNANDYNFGRIPYLMTIETRRLDYLEIPLRFSYHFYNKHAVSAGTSYLHLIQSSDLVTTKNQDGTEKEQKENGYVNVFNTYDIQAHIAYSYELSRYFSLSAEYCLGLTDITNDSKYNLKQQDHNKGMKLSISYKLW
jgi:hypothetical protein